MHPTILCADPQQAVTAIFAVGIRPPGRVWIEFERDRCRTIVLSIGLLRRPQAMAPAGRSRLGMHRLQPLGPKEKTL